MRTAPGSPTRLRAKIASVALALSLLTSGLSTIAAPATADEPTADPAITRITSGTVTWGFKKSWRDYMAGDGTKVLDGASQNTAGEFEFPIKAGTFNSEANELKLELAGTLLFRGYCDATDFCTLDSTYKNFAVTINQNEQSIRADHRGRPRDGGNTDMVEEENALIGVLDINAVSPTSAESQSTWTGIPVSAGPGVRLYSEGTAFDALSLTYQGPSGKPDIGEHWTPEGTPQLSEGVKSAASSDYRSMRRLEYSKNADVVHQFSFSDSTISTPQTVDFTAYDPRSLEPVAPSKKVTLTTSQLTKLTATYAADTDSLYYATTPVAAGSEGLVHRVDFDAETKTYSDPQLITTVAPIEGHSNYDFPASYWDAETQSLLLIGISRNAARAQSVRLIVITKDGNTWKTKEHDLLAAFGAAGGTLNQTYPLLSTSNIANQKINKLTSGVYVAVSAARTPAGGAVPAFTIDLRSENLVVNIIEGAAPPAYYARPTHFSGVFPGKQGEVVLSQGRNTPHRIGWVDGRAKSLSPTLTADDNMPLHQWYTYDSTSQVGYSLLGSSAQIDLLRDETKLGEFIPHEYKTRISNFTTTLGADGTLFMPTNAGDTVGIQRLNLLGISPTITATPKGQSVTTKGTSAKSVTFTASATGTPAPSVQWQQRRSGALKFVNISEATSPALTITADVQANGTEYRAVFTNVAGAIATDPAALNVTAAPQFTFSPTSVTADIGRPALFTAGASGAPTPSITWETNAGSGWQPVNTNEFAAEDGTLVLTSAKAHHNGLKVRAIAHNNGGTDTSAAATLTVKTAAATTQTFTGVALEWTGSHEWQVKPPNGSTANYFSVGESDGTQATYSAQNNDVKVLQRDASGKTKTATWATRGAHVSGASGSSGTGGSGSGGSGDNQTAQLFQFTNGTAIIQPNGSAEITWPGTISVNFYDGIVPFTMSNPRASIDSSGTGHITADLSGYAGDMSNPDKPKTKVTPAKKVVLATFTKAVVNTTEGFVINPNYSSVKVTAPTGGAAQDRTATGWGAWPQPFVDFHGKTGLAAYFYSTGGSFDAGKKPDKFAVGFNGATPTIPTNPGNGTDNGSNPGNQPSTPTPPAISNPTGASLEGSLVWGFKKSFIKYIKGGVANGTVKATGGATSTENVFWFGQKSTTWATGKIKSSTSYGGGLEFYGHHGQLDVKISDLRVRVDSASSGTLLLKHNGKDLEFATLDLSKATKRAATGTLTYAGVPVTLTATGSTVFAYNGASFYPAGTDMDPLSFVIGSTATKAPTHVTVPKVSKPQGADSNPGKSTQQKGKNKKDSTATKQGSLVWGVKSSFRSYVSGPIAKGQISTQAGASAVGQNYWFGQSSTTWKATSSTSSTNYSGSVRFTGHEGILDVTLANPTVRIDSKNSGTLLIASNGTVKEFAHLNLGSAQKTEANGTITYSAVPVTLTAAGANTFAYNGSTFYGAGTTMDPLTFTIGSTAKGTPGATGVVAANEKPWKAPQKPPAKEGISLSQPGPFAPGAEVTATASGFEPNEQNIKVVIYSKPVVLEKNLKADANGNVVWIGKIPQSLTEGKHTLTFQGSVNRGIELEVTEAKERVFEGCTIESASLDWGFKGTFRNYISGGIAHGDWKLGQGVTFEKPNFTWTSGAGAYDPETSTGGIEFEGDVVFSGHQGLLNTTIAQPTIEFDSPNTAVLYLDVSGLSMEDAFAGNTENVLSAKQIPFVTLDLNNAQVTPDSNGTTFTLTQAPTSITADGYANFPNYETGTAFDPLTVEFTVSEDCAQPQVEVLGDVTEQPAEPVAQSSTNTSAGAVPWWIVAAVALTLLGAAATVVIVRRRVKLSKEG